MPTGSTRSWTVSTRLRWPTLPARSMTTMTSCRCARRNSPHDRRPHRCCRRPAIPVRRRRRLPPSRLPAARWDLAEVIGLPVQLRLSARRLDFTAIKEPRWQLVAKELMLALLAPRHPAVATLPRAYRTPLHLSTCHLRLGELTRWLNWLTGRGVTDLSQVSDAHCGAYLDHRRHARDDSGLSSAHLGLFFFFKQKTAY